MNEVYLMGNLTKDVEIRYTKTNKMVCTYTVACSERFIAGDGTEKEVTAFVNCVAWGKLGEAVGNLKKGNRCFVEGRLTTRSYEGKDGQKRYVTEVVANFVGAPLDEPAKQASNFDSFEKQEENIPF
ncbi:single-stranded DNA-binding protein [Veillonella sp. CAG:933]|uniref:single-stranded DNA-binding protein n=1 Tax=Veillonella sp. CAG:933 TaxID=1262980 RepID=UPI0003399EF9|nr:single-stranded DNA-binding protein [Veillonella sp. CAG:933]CCX54658.1 single-stranded DNA-binding protein [Veillonella sp. CAG:933]